MSKGTRTTAKLFLLIVASFLLAQPVLAEPERGRVLGAELTGVLTIQREDGTTHAVDYEGTLRAGLHREQIVIDIIHAGVIRDTGEAVAITSTTVGVFQRMGNQFHFDTAGLFALERQDGSQIVIDITAAGVIQKSGRNIVIDIIHAGIVQDTGENVRLHLTGAGVLQYSGEIAEGTDI